MSSDLLIGKLALLLCIKSTAMSMVSIKGTLVNKLWTSYENIKQRSNQIKPSGMRGVSNVQRYLERF